MKKSNYLKRVINKYYQAEFSKGVIWNILSFALLGLIGILINVIIGHNYGPAVLGVFNQVFAVYIVASQFASLGIHVSVAKYMAQYSAESHLRRKILSSGLIIALCTALFTSLTLFVLAQPLSSLLESPNIARGIIYISFGTVFYALNKVFLGAVNGASLMKYYAFFQALRYGLLLIFLLALIYKSMHGSYVPCILLGAELTLFIALLVFSAREFGFAYPDFLWVKRHLLFGIKAVMGGVVTELNTRVDVLVLGYFASDYVVGIYSFAAILAEGFNQLVTVFRINFNPILAQYISQGKLNELRPMRLRVVNKVFPLIIFGGVLVSFLYPVICRLFFSPDYLRGLSPFVILITGMVLSFRMGVYGNIFSQGGYPGRETMLTLMTVLANCILNVLLIPIWGMGGAAAATATAILFNVMLLRLTAKKLYGVEI